LSTTTSVSLFFANNKYYPNITVHPEHDIASFWVCNFLVDLDELQSTLKAEISVAQQHYQKSTDAWCFSTSDFKVDNKVFVKAQFFKTTQPSKKLSKKYLRSYKIIFQSSILLFTLCLLVYPLSSRLYALCLSSFPCIYAWTCYIQFFPWENSTSPCTSYNWWRIWVWNLLDSRLQNQLPIGMQAPI